jgi:biopolymer transport protein ExbD
MRNHAAFALLLLFTFRASADAPATMPVDGKLPHVQVDVKNKQVRVECQSCNVHQDVGLEFFCVAEGTNEYESVLSSKARASHLHLGMLLIGLVPGEPVKWSESTKKWSPPHGPPVQIFCEWEKDGSTVRVPAYRLMINRKTRKEAPPFTWVFTGSRVMDDNKYAADGVGYLVSVLNNELTVIDIPDVAGRDLDSREWDRNSTLLPPVGTTIWMVIEPTGKKETPTTEPASAVKRDIGATLIAIEPDGKVTLDGMRIRVELLSDVLSRRRLSAPVQINAAPTAPPEVVKQVMLAVKDAHVELIGAPPEKGSGISDVTTDEARIKKMKELWERRVAPHNAALKEAAQAHYDVIETLRREQQRLIDEADRIQRTIDELQKQYQDMTTPRPNTEVEGK